MIKFFQLYNFNRGKVIQIVVAFCVNLLSVLFGLVTAWTSPTIYLLQSPDTPLSDGPMSNEEVSLMTSIMYLSAIFGSLIAGSLANNVGRKWTIFIGAIPQVVAFILIFFAHQIIHIHISRCLSGLAIGIATVIIPIFVTEMADKDLRGTLGNFMAVSMSIGNLLGKLLPILGGFYLTPIVVCTVLAIFSPIVVLFPDTPQFLLLQNRVEEAEISLRFYRGVSRESTSDEGFKLEFEELKKSPSLTKQEMKLHFRDFCGGATILAIICSFWLSNHIAWTGNRVFVSYTDTLLRMAQTVVDVPLMDISVSAVQVVTSVISVFLIKYFGNRWVLIISFLLTFIALVIIGAHFLFIEMGYGITDYTWPFSTAFIVATVIPGSSISGQSYSVAAEILPPKLRGFLLSIYVIVSWLLGFIFLNYFFQLEHSLGISEWMWIFAAWCLFSVILSSFFLPDTRMKNFDDILELFNKKLPHKWRQNTPGLPVIYNTRL